MSSTNEPSFPETLDAAAHEQLVLAWQRARLRRLTMPDGWLSLVARTTLHEGDNLVGADPDAHVLLPADRAPERVGVLRLLDGAVSFEPAAGARVQLRRIGQSEPAEVTGSVALPADAERRGDRLLIGRLALELAHGGGEVTVRVRDPENPRLVGFGGIDTYPISLRHRVVARLVPHHPPRPVELAYDSGRVEPQLSPGIAVFTLDGVEHSVEPVLDGNGMRLFVLFSDLTNRDQTYGAGRFLYAPLPDGERVLLDFNQAFNPPCAHTPYAFCPLTPPQNRLAVRIEAGEKRPHA